MTKVYIIAKLAPTSSNNTNALKILLGHGEWKTYVASAIYSDIHFFYLIEYFEAIEKLQLQDVTEHFMHE